MLQERPIELGDGWQEVNGLLIPGEPRRRYERPVGVDLFAGAGGFSLGFHEAGFHVAGANESDPFAALTYLTNLAVPGVQIHFLDGVEGEEAFARCLRKQWGLSVPKKKDTAPLELSDDDLDKLGQRLLDDEGTRAGLTSFVGSGWIANQPEDERRFGCEHFWLGDVRKLTGERILDDLGLERGELDAIFGGPPCQGFSRVGKREVMDPRNSLIFEFTRLVKEANPKAMCMENVPGIATMITPEGLPVVDALAMDLEAGEWGTLDAIKRSLEVSAGVVGAAVRNKPTPTERQIEREEEEELAAAEKEPVAEQLGLEVEA